MYIIVCTMEERTWIHHDYFNDKDDAQDIAQAIVKNMSDAKVVEIKKGIFTMVSRPVECTVKQLTPYRGEQGPR